MSVDHYNTLGVIPGASAADLRAAYLKLARANHPDKFVGAQRDTAEARMQSINEAWNVLGVAHKRREYDAARPKATRSAQSNSSNAKSNNAGRSGPGQSNAPRGHAHFRPFDDDSSTDPDIDFDTTPIAGSKGMPRWMAFVPVGLVIFGIVVLAFGTVVNAAGVFAIGIMSLGIGAVCFLMLPLFVMSRAERDPEL